MSDIELMLKDLEHRMDMVEDVININKSVDLADKMDKLETHVNEVSDRTLEVLNKRIDKCNERMAMIEHFMTAQMQINDVLKTLITAKFDEKELDDVLSKMKNIEKKPKN